MNSYIRNRSTLPAQGDVLFDREKLQNPDAMPDLYLGNGRFGGCVDALGNARDLTGDSRRFFSHKHHVEVPVGHDLEARLPLVLFGYELTVDGIPFAVTPQTVACYSQTLTLQNALVTTAFTLQNGVSVTVKQYVSLADTAFSDVSITVDPAGHTVDCTYSVQVVEDSVSHHKCPVHADCSPVRFEHTDVLCSSTSRGKAHVALLTEDPVRTLDTIQKTAHRFTQPQTVTVTLMLVSCRGDMTPPEALRFYAQTSAGQRWERHLKAWQAFWQKSMIAFGEPRLQKIWLRFLYALRCAESTAPSVPLSPGGLASNNLWPFEFPQDYNWMYESYFLTNHLEMAAATSRYWNSILSQCCRFTRNYLGVDGAFIPWVPSMFDLKEMRRPATDPPYSWQLHNAAYPVHMIRLYWLFTGDDEYLKFALPVVERVADFYTAISSYHDDSQRYEIRFHPCMGQDEFGGFCRDNYLCCMLSAAYTLKTALAMYAHLGLAPKKEWQDIDRVGYCFEKLMKTGMLATYEDGPTPNPAQKHPSQLNAIATLPIPAIYRSAAFDLTHQRRYEISVEAENNFWTGWSLGTFLLSSVRMRKQDRCDRDFEMLLSNPAASKPQMDARYIRFVETGGMGNAGSYFHTVMGMIVTALTETCVQCFDGVCTVFPVIPSLLGQKPLCFEDLLTPFGYTLSGYCDGGQIALTLCVTRPTRVELHLGEPCAPCAAVTDAMGKPVTTGERVLIFDAQPGEYTVTTVKQ